ncbi:MAG: DUF2877 domain-containing protein [Chloroflexi bacterium]|nr:DUF2877 domain-containing protein [Chloroflexota bacterium]
MIRFSPLHAISLGSAADSLLRGEQPAAYQGHTSRGLFLRLPGEWIVFLTSEAARGPLTVNLASLAGLASELPQGAPGAGEFAHIAGGEIRLPRLGVSIQLDRAEVWRAPPRPAARLNPPQRRAMTAEIIRLTAGLKGAGGLCAALPDTPLTDFSAERHAQLAAPRLRALSAALAQGDGVAVAAAVRPLLGFGPGLTPSGDDLALGLALALNRWGDVLAAGLDVSAINQALIADALRLTSSLSASLLRCASQGEADERLIYALDGMVSGAAPAGDCAARLAEWGSSSALDALAGMALVIRQSC